MVRVLHVGLYRVARRQISIHYHRPALPVDDGGEVPGLLLVALARLGESVDDVLVRVGLVVVDHGGRRPTFVTKDPRVGDGVLLFKRRQKVGYVIQYQVYFVRQVVFEIFRYQLANVLLFLRVGGVQGAVGALLPRFRVTAVAAPPSRRRVHAVVAVDVHAVLEAVVAEDARGVDAAVQAGVGGFARVQ